MSKVLEALCYLDDIAHGRKMDYDAHELKLIIEKELKALEIIKEKRVDIGWLIRSENCSKYNLGVGESQALKKEEYDLLKEILGEY